MADDQVEAIELDDDDRPLPLPAGQALERIADTLAEAVEIVGAYDAAMPLIAAGLDLLVETRCGACRRAALVEVRDAIYQLLREVAS